MNRMGPSSTDTSGTRPPRRSAKAASAEANSVPKSTSSATATAVALTTGSQRSLPIPPRERSPFSTQAMPDTVESANPSGLRKTPGQVRLPWRASAPSSTAARTARVDGQAESRRAGTARSARQPSTQARVHGRAVRPATRAAAYAATTAGTTASSSPGPTPSARSSAAARPEASTATRVAVRMGAASAGRTTVAQEGLAGCCGGGGPQGRGCCGWWCGCQPGRPVGAPGRGPAASAGEFPAGAGCVGEPPVVASASAAFGWASSAPPVFSDIGSPPLSAAPGVQVGAAMRTG